MMILTEKYKYWVLSAIGLFRGNVERQAHWWPFVEAAATTKKFQLGHWLVRGKLKPQIHSLATVRKAVTTAKRKLSHWLVRGIVEGQ